MGFSTAGTGATIDCSTVHVGISNGLNDWNYQFHWNLFLTQRPVHQQVF